MALNGPILIKAKVKMDVQMADIDDVESSASDSDLDSFMSQQKGKTQTTSEKPKKRRCVIS